MAEQRTPRLGLPTWSADTDRHPGRTGTNGIHQELEKKVVVFTPKGPVSARPPAGVEGRVFPATNEGDGGVLYYDLGDRWLAVSTNGGGGPGKDVVVEGAAGEGASQRSARADHTHRIPLATGKTHGAMASQWAEAMQKATTAATGGTLVVRDSAGRVNAADPVDPGHAVTKKVFDREVTNATYTVRPGELVRRWSGNGTFHVPDPQAPSDVASKRYVDSRASRAGWKTGVTPIPYGIDQLAELELSAWSYRDDAPDSGDGYGPVVEDVHALMPGLTTTGDDGAPERVRDRDALWVIARAVQQVEERRALDEAIIDHLVRRNATQDQHIRRLESTVTDLVRILNDLTENHV